MIKKNYQRKHLRAPFKDSILYADGSYVLKATTFNISEGGLFIDELPSFPANDLVPLLISIPELPVLKNLNLLNIESYSSESFPRHVIRAMAKLVRREELSQNLDNIFRSKFGLEFVRITPEDQKLIEDYVDAFTSNIIYLQTLIDTFNSDENSRNKVRFMAKILGYNNTEKISELRNAVIEDYKSLQWL